jgi:hypothetical protein
MPRAFLIITLALAAGFAQAAQNGGERMRFQGIDRNRDGVITRAEWRRSFDDHDLNEDGRLTEDEFEDSFSRPARSEAYRAGYDRGLIEGRVAGREDRERRQGWDLEGQRELDAADSGYDSRFGPRAEYQAGYRDGFRFAYREAFGPTP